MTRVIHDISKSLSQSLIAPSSGAVDFIKHDNGFRPEMSFKLILEVALLAFGQKPIREVWMIKVLLIAVNMTETRCNDFIPVKYLLQNI